jgi:hypothetical protein
MLHALSVVVGRTQIHCIGLCECPFVGDSFLTKWFRELPRSVFSEHHSCLKRKEGGPRAPKWAQKRAVGRRPLLLLISSYYMSCYEIMMSRTRIFLYSMCLDNVQELLDIFRDYFILAFFDCFLISNGSTNAQGKSSCFYHWPSRIQLNTPSGNERNVR